MKKCVAIETTKLIGIGIGKFMVCAVGFVAAAFAIGYVIHYYIPEWLYKAGACIAIAVLLLVILLLVLSWAHKMYENAQVICMMRAEREDKRRP